MEHLSYRERWELGLFSLEKGRLTGDLINANTYLLAGARRMLPDSLQWCSVIGQGTMGITKTQEVPSQVEEELLPFEESRALEELPRESVESPPLKNSKPTWGHSCVTCSRYLGRELDKMISRDPFQP